MVTKEDHHFYIDNASLPEVATALRVLSIDRPLTPATIREIAKRDFAYDIQKDATYAPRRLQDLGLASRNKPIGQGYVLTATGLTLQSILQHDQGLAYELFHYLHYTGSAGHSDARKLLWSYRRCCQLLWASGHLVSKRMIASTILSEAADRFASCLVGAGSEGGFNAGAVGCVYSWLRRLDPSPLPTSGRSEGPLVRRPLLTPSLAGLALDDLYRDRDIQYGDRVILDDGVVDALAQVFFATPESIYSGLTETAKRSKNLRLLETLSGVAVELGQPFGLSDV
jgi:hypothetical protein